MMLAVDIGNTNINFGLINEKGRIKKKYSTPSKEPRLNKIIKKIKKSIDIDKIYIVSVVPKLTRRIKRDLKRKFNNASIAVVGDNVKVPIKCAYSKTQIGQDRLVTAFAARLLYGLPILIIDFGTAVTFDVVSKKGAYSGGLIVPGIKMSLESLFEGTAMLPKTYLKKTSSFIGRDTTSSIRNGMIYGYGAMCEGLINSFRRKIDKNIRVVATGGDASLISGYTPSMKKIDLDLSLKGLYLLSRFA